MRSKSFLVRGARERCTEPRIIECEKPYCSAMVLCIDAKQPSFITYVNRLYVQTITEIQTNSDPHSEQKLNLDFFFGPDVHGTKVPQEAKFQVVPTEIDRKTLLVQHVQHDGHWHLTICLQR